MRIYVINMGRQSAENYHVGLATNSIDEAIKFISEHLIYGTNYQFCNHIYNRVNNMECWENGEILYEYGSLRDDKINIIEDDETLTIKQIEEDLKKHIDKINKYYNKNIALE